MPTCEHADLITGENIQTKVRSSVGPSERFWQKANYRKAIGGKRCQGCDYHTMIDANSGNTVINRADWRYKCKKVGAGEMAQQHQTASDVRLDYVCDFWKNHLI